MSAHFHNQVKNMTRDRQARILAQSTETLAEAQAALEQAQASYDNYPSNRNAYREAAAKDRVAAAKRRPDERVMAWGAARAASMEADQNLLAAYRKFQVGACDHPQDLEKVAYRAKQAAILAWGAVESQRLARRVVAQVEALRPVAPRLICPALRAEWQTSGGI